MRVQGSIPPMVTPIDGETGEIDCDTLRSFTEFLVTSDVHGLFPCGSTGEFPSLTRQQRQTVIETVVEAADGTPVLAGCGHPSVEGVGRLVDDAEHAGADAAVVVTPYYLETSQDSLREFFTLVGDAADIPIVLYEIPSLTGHHLSTETVAALAGHENIIGLKTSTGDALAFFDVIERVPRSFDLLTGAPELTIQSLNVGGDGVIAGPANVFPQVVSDVYSLYRAGHYERARDLMNEIVLPCLVAIRSMPTVPALKYLVSLRGFDAGPPMPPLPKLTEIQRNRLQNLFADLEATPKLEHDD